MRVGVALEQEQRLSFNRAAKWTNRFVVSKLPHGVRISFGEAAPGEDKAFDFHSAVIMTPDDANHLWRLLRQIVGE